MDEQFNEELIELELIDDDASFERIVRQSFRISLKDFENCVLSIGGRIFPLIDISLNGACFKLGNDVSFHVSEILRDCCLNFNNIKIDDLDCEVIRFAPAVGTPRFCGVKWLNLTMDLKQCLETVYESFKKELLKSKKSDCHESHG